MKKVENSKKVSLLKLKKALAMAGLAFTLGAVAAPITAYAEDEVLFQDDSSDDVHLEDASTPAPADTKPAEQGAQPSNETAPVVEQTNNQGSETRGAEQVNDGTVDTSKDVKPEDAKKDEWNGDNNDYFDDWDKSKDPDPKAGEYIDSPDELERKGLKPTPTPTPEPTPTPTPDHPDQPDTPTPSNPTPGTPVPPAPVTPTPVAKTGDNPWLPAAGVAGANLAILALYELRKRALAIKAMASKAEDIEVKTRGL